MNDNKYDISETDDKYVTTKYINGIAQRAMIYLKNGFPVHLRGSAGIGKTSLAFHIAKLIGKPVLLICGSEEINGENLIGGFYGIKKYYMEDNFINSVYKKKEIIGKSWSDGRLLTACKEGYTVIYDEFTRTPPEINNVLLSILEEKIVDIPYSDTNEKLKIDPGFKIIFTSNPEEYVGVYKSPNALVDRMITIDMDMMDDETERRIIMTKSGLSVQGAEKIMRLSQFIRKNVDNSAYMSLRCSIMLSQIVRYENIKISRSNALFRNICKDVYNSIIIATGLHEDKKRELDLIIDKGIDAIIPEDIGAI